MWENELELAKNIAVKAGKKIMEYYHGSFEVDIKSDDSPVTSADRASNEIIVSELKRKYPYYAILSEENDDDFSRLDNDFVWIIDPLDGTQDFVDHGNGFAVNIALAYKHEVVVGVVYIPVNDELYYASKGNGSFCVRHNITNRISVSNKTNDLTCLTSLHFFGKEEKALINKHADRITICRGAGASIKACLIAEGKAEICYRLYPNTKEWDTAAPQILVEEAGGYFLKPDGTPLRYNREDVNNREGFIIVNSKDNLLL